MAGCCGATWQYDGMGNILDNGGNVTFSYDAAGRLAVLTRALPGQPMQTVTNQYNGKGERSFTHRVLSPTERYVEYYTYAEDGRLMSFVQSEQLPDNSLGVRTVYNYIWLDSIPVAQFRERYDSTGTHLDSQLVYIHADHLDTPRIATGYSDTTQSDRDGGLEHLEQQLRLCLPERQPGRGQRDGEPGAALPGPGLLRRGQLQLQLLPRLRPHQLISEDCTWALSRATTTPSPGGTWRVIRSGWQGG